MKLSITLFCHRKAVGEQEGRYEPLGESRIRLSPSKYTNALLCLDLCCHCAKVLPGGATLGWTASGGG